MQIAEIMLLMGVVLSELLSQKNILCTNLSKFLNSVQVFCFELIGVVGAISTTPNDQQPTNNQTTNNQRPTTNQRPANNQRTTNTQQPTTN